MIKFHLYKYFFNHKIIYYYVSFRYKEILYWFIFKNIESSDKNNIGNNLEGKLFKQ